MSCPETVVKEIDPKTKPPEGLSSPKKSADSWKIRFILLLFGTLVGLFFLEIAVRIIEPNLKANRATDRPKFWYVPESSMDNRNAFYDEIKPPGVFRVIVVGDSFTYGGKSQFDDSFPKRLERMLNLNKDQPRVEVISWGVPGYSTAQELTLIKRAISEYHPDLIILQITLNDPELAPYRITHHIQNKHSGQVELKANIFKYWHTLGIVVERIYNNFLQREFVKYYFDLFDNPRTWDLFSSSINGIAALGRESKVPITAVLFPLFSYPLNQGYPFQRLHQKVSDKLQASEIPLLDLFESYRDISPERLQVVPGLDPHPNEIAHRIAADAIYRMLLDKNLLPEKVIIKEYKNRPRWPIILVKHN